MAQTQPLRNPWLIAAWPGMGQVAVGAAGYLVGKLGASLVHELSPREHFDIQQVTVKDGVAKAGRMPRSMFFEWRDPAGERDLLMFVGEAQPSNGGYQFCHQLLDYATKRGIERVVTFAAMATQLHPSEKPRVFAVASDPKTLSQVREQSVEVLKEGQISGLNGVLLGAAAERGLPGICLMGELPFFAAGVPNPRASQAALEVFSSLAAIQIDLTEIKEQAKVVEKGLLQLLEQLKEAARRQQTGVDEEGFTVPEFARDQESSESEDDQPEALDYATRQRIEKLFQEAERDRSRAFQLKEELDRLGVFKQYEDRFLDLFKKAE